MKKADLFLLSLGLVLGLSQSAASGIYRHAPSAATCIYCQRPQTRVHHFHHAHTHRHHRHHRHHRLSYHYHPKPTSPRGLFVYYALPAPGCCDGSLGLPHCQCCAEYGNWSARSYATFRAGPEDLIYSATNEDSTYFDPYGWN